MIALVDCNNFYASCERIFRPDLENKPIVVLSNNDGCIIARSKEAKELGIPMSAPVHKYTKIIIDNHVQVFSSNYALYGDLSQRVMNILACFTPKLEIYSIDEAFLDLSGIVTHPIELAKQIQQRIKQWIGIPVSVGIAPTKSLAKLANRIAKQFPELNGIHLIDTDSKRLKAINWVQVKDLWGIGVQYKTRLETFGIKTAYELTQQSDSFIKKHFTVVGLRLKKELEGTPCFTFENEPPSKQNISTSRSFGELQTELPKIQEAVSTFVVNSARKLRKQKLCAQTMMVFLHTNGFREDHLQYSRNVVINLPVATNSSLELSKYAGKLVEVIYKEGYYFHKAGVIFSNLIPEDQVQLNFLDQVPREKHQTLLKIIDGINDQKGRDTIKLASQGKNKSWKLKQELRSKRYTTNWDELFEINE